MVRTSVTVTLALTLAVTVAHADKAHVVRDLPSSPAVEIANDADGYTGCGLNHIARAQGTGPESMMRYDAKRLTALARGVPPTDVWGWCVKPDLAVRVWSACFGAGDSTRCTLYAATIGTSGKLGRLARIETGWDPPKVERIDSSDAPKQWIGSALKVSMEAGRGKAWFALHLRKGKLTFSKKEWDE